MNYPIYEAKWNILREKISEAGGNGRETVDALVAHHEIYTEGLVEWLARLYDKDIGGFYYSNSGRDNDGFLPDIESTMQALNIIRLSGMIDSPKEIPKEMRRKIAMFVCSLMDPDDGYIYHPQWGKNISDSRRGRDLMWAINTSDLLKFRLPYSPATERLQAASQGIETEDEVEPLEHLKSEKALLSYLESYDWKNNAYYAGNNLAAQMYQVSAAGLADVAIDFLDSVQNKETGLWANNTGYDSVNGAFKISFIYDIADKPLKHAEKIAKTAMNCITSFDEETRTACYIYNTWYTIINVMQNIEKYSEDGKARAAEIRKECLLGAPEAIRATTAKVVTRRKPDGSFSMANDRTSATSQGAPVAKRLPNGDAPNEGDVNATVIAGTSITTHIYRTLGLLDYRIPLFSKETYKSFLSIIGY